MEEQNVTISKKKLYVIVGVILLVLLVMIAFLVKATKNIENRQVNKQENRQEKKEIKQEKRAEKRVEKVEENEVASQDSVKSGEVVKKEEIKPGYKKIISGDGSFSFAIPENWNVEKNNKVDLPIISVSASVIWHTDWSGDQTDFNLKNENLESVVNKIKGEQESYCKGKPNTFVGCGVNASTWSKSSVGGKNAYVEADAMDKDEQGNEVSTKGGPGGKTYYIEISNNKTLTIWKQARGDSQFESDFDYLIQTLEFN